MGKFVNMYGIQNSERNHDYDSVFEKEMALRERREKRRRKQRNFDFLIGKVTSKPWDW